jgi:hypothetical protein
MKQQEIYILIIWIVTPCRLVDGFVISVEFAAYILETNLYREDGGSKSSETSINIK